MVPATTDTLIPTPRALRHGLRHRMQDALFLKTGILDPLSYEAGYKPEINPVEVRVARLVSDKEHLPSGMLCTDPRMFTDPVTVRGEVRDRAFNMQRRAYKQITRSHNLRTTMGRDQWQRVVMHGDVGSGTLNGYSATGHASTAPTATTWTGAAGTAFPTATSSAGNAGLQGHLALVSNAISGGAYTNPVLGVILSNTATVLTVDQWYAVPVTGAAGSTPATASAALILPGAAWMAWIGLCATGGTGTPPSGGHAPAAGDVLRTADGLFGDGTGGGAASEKSSAGLARAYVACTYPSAGQTQFQNTWTYTGSSLVTIDVVVLANSKAAAGSLLELETQLNAGASVQSNGDTIQVTWQENL